ncbi:MAG TPA: hypothetical protein VM536_12750 [Chloroflexia bacterium]|nr:hypothetical protein [Chloroflexia bacterium]
MDVLPIASTSEDGLTTDPNASRASQRRPRLLPAGRYTRNRPTESPPVPAASDGEGADE